LREAMKFVAGLHERVETPQLRGMAGGNGERGRAAFKRCDALFEHGLVGFMMRV
jgi:hypothetical protein